jgi:hypothetical protein
MQLQIAKKRGGEKGPMAGRLPKFKDGGRSMSFVNSKRKQRVGMFISEVLKAKCGLPAPTPNTNCGKSKHYKSLPRLAKIGFFLIINCQNFINNYNYYGSGFEAKKKRKKKEKKRRKFST